MATVELPSFHIECKGTVSKVLKLSILKKWYKQLEDDCPKDKLAVLFHFANGIKPFTFAPLGILKEFNKIKPSFSIVFSVVCGDTFSPKKYMIDHYAAATKAAELLGGTQEGYPNPHAFQLTEEKYFIVFDSEIFLNYMKDFEKSKGTTSLSEHNTSLPESR